MAGAKARVMTIKLNGNVETPNAANTNVHGDRRVNYEEMATCASILAGNLLACGLERRDRVAIWLEKSVEEAVAFFGISAASGVIVPINTLLVERQVKHILDDCSVRFLVTSAACLAEHRDMLAKIRSRYPNVIVNSSEPIDPPTL